MQHGRIHASRFSTLALATLYVPMVLIAAVGARAQHGRPTAAPIAAGAPAHPTGWWKPVSYGQDLSLASVFFVTGRVGWASGDAGTILFTKDAGATWTPQLGGDPQSHEPAICMLRFVDGHHGWAFQNGKLLRTTDGTSWEVSGTMPEDLQDYTFVSPTVGIALGGLYSAPNTLYRTTDGGLSWKPMAQCEATLQANGLTQKTDCWLLTVSFPTPSVGYAAGGHPMCGGCGGPPLMMKTEDGGVTWRVMVGPGDLHTSTILRVAFLDERTGFVRLSEGKIFMTTDGGATWRGLVGSPKPSLTFTDPEVGWAFGQRDLAYTVDGGHHWSSRVVDFPSYVNAFSLPRRDRAYVVGDHGMIFRYSVVPRSVVPPHAITSPAMPAFGGRLRTAVDSVDERSKALAAAIQAAARGAAGAPGATRAAGGRPVVETCCATRALELEGSIGALPSIVSSFTSSHRNLNLVIAGLELASRLPTEVSRVRTALASLRQATAQSSALSALAELTATVDSLHQTARFAMLDDPPLIAGADANTGAAAPAATIVSSPAAGPVQSAGGGTSTGATAAGGASADSSKTKTNLAQKAKGFLKKIHIP